jgi:hypothetical protein
VGPRDQTQNAQPTRTEGASAEGQSRVELNNVRDKSLESLLDTHQRMSRRYFFGAMGALCLGVAILWGAGHHEWDHLLFVPYLVAAGLGALGSRPHVMAKARRLGLSDAGRKEFFHRLHQLQFRSTWAERRRRAKEVGSVPRDRRLKIQVRHLREISLGGGANL